VCVCGAHTCMGTYGFVLLNVSVEGKTSAIWCVLYVLL
jgi:hypothetical protein